ncbi:MAG: hypothetical protein EON95_03575 [Caulobacteraceae bacterium]|nr:MAG: hypothetical protein EON95_03575 [Caulobacteraceae bacterium]
MTSILLALMLAASPDISAAIGATIVSTHPDGRQATLRLKADHSYSAVGRKGQRSGGSWTLKAGKLCLSQKAPYPGPFPVCKPIPAVKAGETWKDTAFNGDKVTNRIVR